MMSPQWRRFLGFTALPVIAAISPLVVLPFVARAAGPDGWASALSGEAIGTFAAIALAYGWTTIGPARVAVARPDERGRFYRESLVVRALCAAVALPATVMLATVVASDGHVLLASLMGLQGALIAMSYTWFAVGVGTPSAIAIFDAVPRVLVAIGAAFAISSGAPVEIYPLAGIGVTLVGTGLYTARTLRHYPGNWPRRSDLPRLFRRDAPVAVNEATMGFYSSVPLPVVNLTSPGIPAAGFASADKLLKLGQFVPLTLANALQLWSADAVGEERARRLTVALISHAALGAAGWVVLAVVGQMVSTILFGAEATPPPAIFATLGFAFACYCVRTSMIRHVLFAAHQARAVMTATLVASAIGVPALIMLTVWIGPLGAALGYALVEALSTCLLIRPTARAYRLLSAPAEV
jgi:O-antigen/teichoic acid export membrane protein